MAALILALQSGLQAGAPPAPLGYMNFYTFNGDQRTAIQAGTAKPDGSFYPKRAEGPYNGYPGVDPGDDDTNPPGDSRNNYNMVLKGYFYPPKTGKLQLAIATDDAGVFYASTDDNPANKKQLATESQWNAIRSFGGAFDGSTATRRTVITTGDAPIPRPENWTPFITVTKGKPIYIELVGTEFGGGDNAAISYRFDGDPDFADGDKPISGQYLSPFQLPAAASIIAQPSDAAAYDGNTATFSVAVDAPPSVTVNSIKWTKNGVDVPDSNTNSITVTAKLADDGAKYKAFITTSAGLLTSTEAVLYVSSFTSDFARGVVKFEAWTGISGTSVSGLLDDPHYQDAPDDTRVLAGIDTPNGYADNYGARVSGYIIPVESGNYRFFIRSDDASQFFLSKTEIPPNPAVDTPVMEETGCCNAFLEPLNASGDPVNQTSQTPISLVAGKKYAFLAFVKEGGGGDFLQVAMRKEGDATLASALKPISGALVGANVRPTKGEPKITLQPKLPDHLEEGAAWTFTVDGVVTPEGYNYPFLVQWQKDGVDIPGATSKTYRIAAVVPGDSGKYRAVVSAPSGKSLNSTEITATVISDKIPPTLASAQKAFSADTKVLVTFSEPVSSASANTVGNYKINNGITVSAAKLTANARVVELTTTAIAKGSQNQLTVSGVQDVHGNSIAANSSIAVGFQKGVYFVSADPGPLTFAGDLAVNQHLIDRGFDVALARGSDVPDDGSTALGRDLIVQSSSLGSGTVENAGIGKFRNLAIPAIEWEASNVDAYGFQEANANPGTTGAQTQINIVDATHPLAAGFPVGLVTTSASETYSQAQPVNAHVIATLASDSTQKVLFYYEKGDKGFNDFVMPARRVFFFFQDNTASVATDAGWKLFDAAVDWSLGIQAQAPPPVLSVARNGASLTLSWTNGGKLQSATSLVAPVTWTDESSASPFTTTTSAGAVKFYRVSQ